MTGAVARLALLPESGSPVEDSDDANLREVILDPYRIIYEYDGSDCTIHAVIHSKQDHRTALPEFFGDDS